MITIYVTWIINKLKNWLQMLIVRVCWYFHLLRCFRWFYISFIGNVRTEITRQTVKMQCTPTNGCPGHGGNEDKVRGCRSSVSPVFGSILNT